MEFVSPSPPVDVDYFGGAVAAAAAAMRTMKLDQPSWLKKKNHTIPPLAQVCIMKPVRVSNMVKTLWFHRFWQWRRRQQ